jgi:hypothetical protein
MGGLAARWSVARAAEVLSSPERPCRPRHRVGRPLALSACLVLGDREALSGGWWAAPESLVETYWRYIPCARARRVRDAQNAG